MKRWHPRLGYIGLCVFTLTAAREVSAQEWTRFRGPNGTGISAATLPVVANDETIAWKAELPGVGHAGPVLWGDKIFLLSADPEAGKQHVFCYSAKTGKQLWVTSRDFTKYPKHNLNSFASSTPTVDAERLYVNWFTPDSFKVVAYDHNGKPLWERDMGAYTINHGGGSSPVVVGDTVVVRSDSEGGPECFIAGLDKKTGVVKWRTPRGLATKGSFSSPVLYQPKGGAAQLIFTSNANGFASLDPATGKVNWEVLNTFGQRCISQPVLFGDLIFGTCGDGAGSRGATAVKLGSPMPTVAYTVPKGVPYVPSPVVFGDHIYLWGDSGVVTCIKAATGEQVWMERVGGGGNFYGSPVCAGGKLYNVSERGELVVLDASPTFKLEGRSQLGEGSHSTPAIANGMMFIRTFTHVIALGGKKL
jgi:outer membrane protein assembly factor BamB